MNRDMAAAHPLEDINFFETNSPTVCGMQVLDEKGRSLIVAVNSQGLSAVVEKLLDQAKQPVFAAASNLATGTAPQCHIDADRFALEPGRSPTEVALRLQIGCLEVVAFVPLDATMAAIEKLVNTVDRSDSPDSGLH